MRVSLGLLVVAAALLAGLRLGASLDESDRRRLAKRCTELSRMPGRLLT